MNTVNQEELRVTLVQTSLFWENPQKNYAHFSKKLALLDTQTDLIILPEMFSTGFSMNAPMLAETNDGFGLKWMQTEAEKHQAAVTGSIIVEENKNYYNRLYFVLPDGSYQTYDKRHTFTYADEDEVYTAGTQLLSVNYKGWRIRPLICYDLRFPVWSRNDDEYDLVFYIASWPKKRMLAWDTLLRARAIENMAYCIGVNRTGADGNGHEYVGHSAVYDSVGNLVSDEDFEKDFVQTSVLSKKDIETNRKHFQFLEDKDDFKIII